MMTPLEPSHLPESIDLISARREFYDYPTALPTVERSSIKLDLQRRDFTINTLALRLDGRHYGSLYDYWDGANDLRRGLIRVLHSLSFVDDPTRILRAIRFEQRFSFQTEARTLQLLVEACSLLRQVSGERLRHELDQMLAEPNPDRIFIRLQKLELLAAIHPELQWTSELKKPFLHVLQHDPEEIWDLPQSPSLRRNLAYIVWLGNNSTEKIRAISSRLRLPHHTLTCLLSSRKLWKDLEGLASATPSQVVNRLENVPREVIYAIYQQKMPAACKEQIMRYLTEWINVKPVTDGDRLQQMQIPPGPIYRKILAGLRSAWLDGRIQSESEEELYLQQMLKQI